MYLSTHAASPPLELFVRVKGADCTAETIALYDVLARLASVALQYGCPHQPWISPLWREGQTGWAGHRTPDDPVRSLPDAIGQHLLSLCPDVVPVHPKA